MSEPHRDRAAARKSPLESDIQPSKTAELSAFLTSKARFSVKTDFHEKCSVFEVSKKVAYFFDTLKKTSRAVIVLEVF